MYEHPATAYPRKRRVWPWILVGVLAVLGCLAGGLVLGLAGTGAAINEGVKAVEAEAVDRQADVKIGKCDRETLLDVVEVSYTVTNSGDTPRTYVPTFDIVTADGTVVGQASDITSELAPGAVYKGKAVGAPSEAGGKITCRLTSA